MRKNLLQIFAKAPVSGYVKTRLAVDIGDDAAKDVYLELLCQTLDLAMASSLTVELWCAPDDTHGFFQQCVKEYGVTLSTQCDGDLGKRMRFALNSGLERYDKVALIGADCPVLTLAHLSLAFDALDKTDVVFNPAEDGGFVLLASRQASLRLFDGMEWGGANVLTDALRLTEKQGLSTALLSTLWDVDVLADFKRWRKG